MELSLYRIALAAGLTSVLGYAFKVYRDHQKKAAHETDHVAEQEWETDGGSNLTKVNAPVPLNPGVTRTTGEMYQPRGV